MTAESNTKVCESCGKQFGCGAKLAGCWCTELQLSTEITEGIKSAYLDCLCPDCLNTFQQGPAIIITYPNGDTAIVTGAVRVDTQNFHEGMVDFYDERGNLLKQISMHSNIKWDCVSANKTAG